MPAGAQKLILLKNAVNITPLSVHDLAYLRDSHDGAAQALNLRSQTLYIIMFFHNILYYKIMQEFFTITFELRGVECRLVQRVLKQ